MPSPNTTKRYVNSFREELESMNLGRKGEEGDLEFGKSMDQKNNCLYTCRKWPEGHDCRGELVTSNYM